MNVLIVADTDSRVKWANFFIETIGLTPVVTQKEPIVNDHIANYDVVLLALGGGANYKFLQQFHNFFSLKNLNSKRPIVISGFNGIVEPRNSHALLCRVGSDIICLNSKVVYAEFSEILRKLNYTNKTLFLTGLAKDYSVFSSKNRNKIVFFAQPDIPKTKRERVYIIERLQELALKYKDYDICIKPRSNKKDKNITHKEIYFYQDILKELKIQNIHLLYNTVENILQSTKMCITIGSTVAIEAIYNNIETVILSDFGIKLEYGNHHFINSGCLMSFNEIISGKKPNINQKWKEEYVLIDGNLLATLNNNIRNKILLQKRTNNMLALEPLYYSKENAPFIYLNTKRINKRKKTFLYRIKNILKI